MSDSGHLTSQCGRDRGSGQIVTQWASGVSVRKGGKWSYESRGQRKPPNLVVGGRGWRKAFLLLWSLCRRFWKISTSKSAVVGGGRWEKKRKRFPREWVASEKPCGWRDHDVFSTSVVVGMSWGSCSVGCCLGPSLCYLVGLEILICPVTWMFLIREVSDTTLEDLNEGWCLKGVGLQDERSLSWNDKWVCGVGDEKLQEIFLMASIFSEKDGRKLVGCA